ncbi:hypothetical protein C2E25_00965 [Geothermobacter hydrogeniphilus]|uniref:histidine kinase n=1 Tax=Geothermobacter hydrogeniphilus TaxID=1969733 RepID=A0A2K2HEW7_9BACT|nr:PAS domain-containing protein [Geothermobacter hydrogeniphilus]PNU21830.1 hypothetical protein C2E25_00965 [Geothermobacter hydrogeniphilus]
MTKLRSLFDGEPFQGRDLFAGPLPWLEPKRLLLMMVLAVFAVETLVMFTLHLIPGLPVVTEAVVDSCLLLLVLSPILYYFHYCPLQLHYRAGLQTTNRLLRSEERLRLVQGATNDGLWDWDIATESVYYNPRFAAMLGYRRDDLKPFLQTWRKLLHPEEKTQVLETLDEHLAGKNEHYRAEYRVKTAGGEWLWVLARGRVVSRDEAGGALRMVGTLTDISDRKRAEQALLARKQEVGQLSRQLMLRSEEEKRHLAQDLHDEFGQVLSAFQLGVEVLQKHRSPGGKGYQEQCNRLLGLVSRLERDIRHISRHLRPVMLDDLGLVPTLRSLAAELESQVPGLTVEFSIEEISGRLETDLEMVCYRICQEALHNCLKHSAASRVRITLRSGVEWVEMIVRDNGRGFEVRQQPERDSHWGMGLLGMRERAHAVAGSCDICSTPGGGTSVVCQVPARFVEEGLCRTSAS